MIYILKLIAGFIVVLIIIGATLAVKLLEEDHKKKTRRYNCYSEREKNKSIADKDSFQSYRDRDPDYQAALRALGSIKDKGDKD